MIELQEKIDKVKSGTIITRSWASSETKQRLVDGEARNIYSDGGLIGPNPSPIGGTYGFCITDDEGELIYGQSGIVLPYMVDRATVTNNHSEWIALVKALEMMNEGWSGTVFSDSYITLGRLFYGFRLTNLSENLINRGFTAVNRLSSLEPILLAGHPTKQQLVDGWRVRPGSKNKLPVSRWNVWCDKACSKLAKDYKENYVESSSN